MPGREFACMPSPRLQPCSAGRGGEWRHNRRSGLSVAPRFLRECLTHRTEAGFPATSNGACRFPALSCSLRKKIYEVQAIGDAFEPGLSPASTPQNPTASVFPFLYILRLRSRRLPSVFVRRPCPPSLPEKLRNSWVPSLPV